MADLLECLIQIKGLRESPARLEAFLKIDDGTAWRHRPAPGVWAPVEVAAHLADAEMLFGLRLRQMLTATDPVLPGLNGAALAARSGYLEWPPLLAAGRFTVRRAETLELLDTCTAHDLERKGRHSHRGFISIADLVAVMLAHDTTHLGQIRQRLVEPAAEPSLTQGERQ